jgi:hypothetical protein
MPKHACDRARHCPPSTCRLTPVASPSASTTGRNSVATVIGARPVNAVVRPRAVVEEHSLAMAQQVCVHLADRAAPRLDRRRGVGGRPTADLGQPAVGLEHADVAVDGHHADVELLGRRPPAQRLASSRRSPFRPLRLVLHGRHCRTRQRTRRSLFSTVLGALAVRSPRWRRSTFTGFPVRHCVSVQWLSASSRAVGGSTEIPRSRPLLTYCRGAG